MPREFRPVTIPLSSGVREDTSDVALDAPEQLAVARNLCFTKTGAVKGRPGLVPRDGVVQYGAAGTSTAANLATAVGSKTPAGVCPAAHGGEYGTESPVLLYQGAAYCRKETLWLQTGVHWSTRVTKSVVLRHAFSYNPVPCGEQIVGIPADLGVVNGVPWLNTAGEITGYNNVAGTTDATAMANRVVAGNAVFYPTAAGDLYAEIPGVFPAASLLLISAGVSTTAARDHTVAAVKGESGAYYVAFVSTVAAGRVTLKRLNSAGTVTATQDVNGLGTVQAVHLAFDGTNKLCLGVLDSAVPALTTKVFTTTSTTFTDAAIDVVHAGTPDVSDPKIDIGLGHHADIVSVLFRNNANDVIVTGRLFSAATLTTGFTLYGGGGSINDVVDWDVMFAGRVVAGRTLIGVLRSTKTIRESGQWIVLDVTDAYIGGNSRKVVVACGPVDGCIRMAVSSAAVTGNSLNFAVNDGLSYDANGVATVGAVRVQLTLQASASDSVSGLTFFSGATPRSYDGLQHRVHGFPENYPSIMSGSGATAGGALTDGTHTYQVIWEYTNALGQIVRSAPSTPQTYTTNTGAGNRTVTLVISVPQLQQSYSGDTNRVRVKLYATVVNPSPGAALFLVSTQEITAEPVTHSLTMTHGTEPQTDEEQLYTVGNVLSDEPAPGGDRGVVWAGDRIWVADQRRVHASKLLTTRFAPAWSTSGQHTLTVPVGLGQITGLGRIDDKLIVVCSGGVLMVYGAGYDDLGQGPGWAMQVLSTVGSGLDRGPRTVCSTPEGVVFLGAEGDAHVVTRGLEVRCISRQVRDGAWTFTPDVTWVGSRKPDALSSTNPLVVLGPVTNNGMRVLDTEVGAWSHWVTPYDHAYCAGVSGALWVQAATSVLPVAATFTQDDVGEDSNGSTTTAFAQRVTTGGLRPDGQPGTGWGRFRGLSVLAKPAADDYTLAVEVREGPEQRLICQKNKSVVAGSFATYPHGPDPEFRATRQRCGYLTVDLQATPGIVEWSAIDLWVAGTPERAPSRNRS